MKKTIMKKSWLGRFSIIFFILMIILAVRQPAMAARTIIDNERGAIYTSPYDGDWTGLGAYVGNSWTPSNWRRMSEDAIKISQGRFHVFRVPDGEGSPSFVGGNFPYAQLMAELPDVFITAGGPGQYVYWRPSMNNTYAPYYKHAVNVADDRFVRFWVDEYVYPILFGWTREGRNRLTDPLDPQTEWVGVDECIFNLGRYSPSTGWDEPFPQNEAEYLESINQFFVKLKAYDPTINVMCNLGTPGTWDHFYTTFANISGVMLEDLRRAGTVRDYFDIFQWFGEKGGVAILRDRSISDNETSIRTAYAAYLIARGDNFFWNPRISGYTEMDPGKYETMKNALGLPIARWESPSGSLYMRSTERGIVFYNTGSSTQTITLPTDRTYYNRSGSQTTSITVAGNQGDYVTSSTTLPTATSPPLSPTPTPPSGLPVCYGANNIIDSDDLRVWPNYYRQNYTLIDFNSDGVINSLEFAYLLANWGQTCTQ